jgi:hypothetical protein
LTKHPKEANVTPQGRGSNLSVFTQSIIGHGALDWR